MKKSNTCSPNVIRVTYVRDDSGVICLFNRVTKFPGQDERYRRELRDRADIADFVRKALAEADRKTE